MRKIAMIIGAAVLAFAALGCGGPERTITKEEDQKWRTPPSSPPAEYHGNVMGAPGGPPPGKAGSPPGAGGPPPGGPGGGPPPDGTPKGP